MAPLLIQITLYLLPHEVSDTYTTQAALLGGKKEGIHKVTDGPISTISADTQQQDRPDEDSRSLPSEG